MDRNDLEKIIQLRHDLHAHPELSLKEDETKARLMAFLEENTDISVADRGKWFYAVSGSDGPAGRNPVTFRADLDALPIPETICLPYGSLRPGVSHKCGHDGHAAALAGLALELSKKKIRDRSVYLIFQMGEEIGRAVRNARV